MHGPSRGGGFSSGGHSSGGSHGSSFHYSTGGSYPTPRAPRYVPFFNRILIISNWMFSLLTFVLIGGIILITLLITSATSLSDNKKQIHIMEQDAIGFEQLITHANAELENDDYYLFTIENINFTSDSGYLIEDDLSSYFDGYFYTNGTTSLAANYCFTYEGIDYYQIYYAFTDKLGNQVTDFTYACYPDPILNIKKLTIAYQFENGVFQDSINADYDLEKCMEYHIFKDDYASAKTNCIIMGSLLGAIVLVVIVFGVYAIKKSKTKQEFEAEKHQAEIDKLNAETDLTRAEIKKKNRVCAYCGGEIPEDATYCPGCGSRQSE